MSFISKHFPVLHIHQYLLTMGDTIQNVASVFSVDRDVVMAGCRRQRRRSIIRNFALNTTTHGLPGIARSESIHNRVFWSISTIAFTAVLLYFITQSIRDYFDYPTQTSVDVVVEWPIPFPAFTLCNYSPLRQDHFTTAFIDYLNQSQITNITDPTTVFSKYIHFIRDFLRTQINQNNSLEQFFFPLEAMLISCRYNDAPCNSSDFIAFNSPVYGRCYTFNAKMKDLPNGGVRDCHMNGGNGVLDLYLYVHSHQYIPFLSDAIGAIVMVHDNNQLPLVDSAGMVVGPGQRHRLSFTRKRTRFLPPPYTDCTMKIPLAMQAMFSLYQNADYAFSQPICYTNCIQAYVYSICGCVNPNQWASRTVFVFGTDLLVEAPLCNYTDPCYTRTADSFMAQESLWRVWCKDCTQECEAMSFGITISSMLAPTDWMKDGIRSFVENTSMPLPWDWSTSWESYVRSSYVSVEVVRESLLLEKLTQESTLSWIDVLSNVGGHSGLWLGISFLSLMELAEMLYRLSRSNYHAVRLRFQPKLIHPPHRQGF